MSLASEQEIQSKKCVDCCQAKIYNESHENKYSCFYENLSFYFETEGYGCNFIVHHSNTFCLPNDSFMEFDLKQADKVVYSLSEKLSEESFENYLLNINYDYNYSLSSNPRESYLKIKEYPQSNIIKIETSFGKQCRFNAIIKNIEKPRVVTNDNFSDKNWFILKNYTQADINFQLNTDYLYFSCPVSFQYNAHGIYRPLPPVKISEKA